MAENPHVPEGAAEGAESLLKFKETLDFGQFVRSHLISPEHSDLTEVVQSSARLIGQEKDGAVLFAWDTPNENGEVVTQVGWYSQVGTTYQGFYRTLYKHEERVDICAATVNFERTLLAFTVREVVGNTVTYDTFVAEIQPQGRVFTLNLGGPLFRKLQFLQPEASTPKPRIGRHHYISRLLVVIPEDYICLYQFRMQVVRLGSVLTQQPESEVIAENFSWYQWDPHSQWLYYARFESTTSALQASVSGKNSLLLHCVSFPPASQASYQLLLTVSLPLPYNERLYSQSSTYYSSPFAFTAPVCETNLQVLHRRDGVWCVCLQHCTGTSPRTDANLEYEDLDAPQGSKIDYSVYIIHNGYVMYGQVPLAIPTDKSRYIHFMLLGCFVAAYIPGFMLHFLNVGPRTDPCHHLAFGPDRTPQFPAPKPLKGTEVSPPVPSRTPVLTTAVITSMFGDYNAAVVECNSEVIYECGLNIVGFFQLFKTCGNPEMMEDLLHLMVVGFRHHGMALSMVEYICQTPMRLVDHRLFAEFMLASTFANIHFDCKRYVAKQLPLTISSTFRGTVFKNEVGSKLAMLKLTPMPNFLKQLLVQSDQKLVSANAEELIHHKPAPDQPLEVLCFVAVTSQPTITRVDLRELIATTEEKSNGAPSPPTFQKSKKTRHKKGTVSPQLPSPSRGTGIINRISTFTRRSLVSKSPIIRSGNDPQEMLSFLDCDQEEMDSLSEVAAVIRVKLLNTIAKELPLRSKNLVYNTITTYYSELERQSCTLLLVTWQSLGFSMDNHPLHSPINRTPTVKEQILYELLEAYHLAHLELGFPLPLGFHTLFICMGYLCLDHMLFLQYLRNGVFSPTKKFVELLLADCGSTNEKLVFQIICNLEYSLSQYALKHWHNPTVEHLEASSQAARY